MKQELFSFKDKKFTWKSIVFIITLVFLFIILRIILKPESNEKLQKVSLEINKRCPAQLDSITRLDNTFVTGKTLVYRYTIANADQSTYDTSAYDRYLKTRILNIIKTDPRLKFIRDEGVALSHRYYTSSGEYLNTIDIAPEEYQEY
jgi:hypothetical protein